MNKKMKSFCDNKLQDSQYYTELGMRNIKTPITVLLGPNGTGKSMSLLNIEYQLKKNNVQYIKYSTSKDDIVQKGAPAFGNWDISKIAQAFTSEGERMTSSFFSWANEVMVPTILKNQEPLWILVDEADSGLSIDRLYETLHQIVSIIGNEFIRGRKICAVFTCNSYEMYEVLHTKISSYIWVPTKERINPRTYKAFKERYMEYFHNVHEVIDNA